ncbi:DUF1614 domain-containing protein [Methermicoccus shengliensis]|uniref:DUF1614 domain-containing protein n=1 Tax=Methermicoccus shengliensis TaxID=660064 RepID=A0A832VWY9_9EURY|nr:DUF1614 domain-containing protein [Methermicoccus shengliensis]KUK05186.1 MAG: Uncharacterized protein XD46_0179 [Euryarchaeota archaeon 55_53]KUK30805.1 MAG: Uncharacterized protein XD62_0064 [Methanosarcinales archeaon 56_1174]MDI3487346.1 hypothetical protein [Methanosarcinales archaeon]MDN5294580.1 hypothetical protein [Methanosarcinales archaeon]HIH69288.1 DUF1614 domain-containing protein [Methermicoccus shengliensis]
MRELLGVSFYTRFASMWMVALLIVTLCLMGRVHFSALNSFVIAGFVLLIMLLYPVEVCVGSIRTLKPNLTMGEARLVETLEGISFVDEYAGGFPKVFNTRVMVSIGGFIVPIVLAAITFFSMSERLPALVLFMIVFIASYTATELKPPLGLITPSWIALLALPIAYVLSASDPSGVMLVGGVMGIAAGLVAWVFSISPDEEGAAELNLGGYGSFMAMYTSVCLAVLTAVA